MRKTVRHVLMAGIIAALMLALAPSQSLASPTRVRVNAPDEVLAGSTFTTGVDIDYVENLNSGQFDLSYDNSVLSVADVRLGDFPWPAGSSVGWAHMDLDTIRVIFDCPWAAGATGSGTLIEVDLSVIGNECNTSDLDLSNGGLWDIGANDIPVDDWVDDSVHVSASSIVISSDAAGNERNQFYPGEKVYVKASAFTPNRSYKIWIQEDGVVESYGIDSAKDPSGIAEDVSTDGGGRLIGEPILLWEIPEDAQATCQEWDIVVDQQDDGVNTGIYNAASDGIDSASLVGFVAPVPELPTILLFGVGLVGLSGWFGLKRSRKATDNESEAKLMR